MSALERLRQYLGKSPSVVYPEDVLEYVKGAEEDEGRLRDALRELMMGTYAELCTERDASQCRECSMRGESDDSCLVADACEVLGIDTYGEPLGVEVEHE